MSKANPKTCYAPNCDKVASASYSVPMRAFDESGMMQKVYENDFEGNYTMVPFCYFHGCFVETDSVWCAEGKLYYTANMVLKEWVDATDEEIKQGIEDHKDDPDNRKAVAILEMYLYLRSRGFI